MKAVVQQAYGPPAQVLTVRDVPRPVAGETEVLVRVRAASMHPDIWHAVTGLPYALRLMGQGVLRPRSPIPGTDLAGVVESVGSAVTRFKPGDEVFGESVAFGWKNGGAFAEFAAVPEDFLWLKPSNITFEQAASVPNSGFIALSNMRWANRLEGKSVLINGAGGCLGSVAIPIAKAAGAIVTAVDRAEKLAMMRALGADHVVDFEKEDVLKRGERYDFILDIASTLWFDVSMPILSPGGAYFPIGHAHYGKATGRMGGRILGMLPAFIALLPGAMLDPEKRKNFKVPTKPEVMARLAAMLESGQLAPIVARTFPLSEVPAAMKCLEEGRLPGRLVITP